MGPVTAKVRLSPGQGKDIVSLSLPIRVCSVCWGNKNLKLFLAFFVFLHCRACSLQHAIHNTQSNYKTGSAGTGSRSNPVIFAKRYKQINKISHCIFCAQDTLFTLKIQA